MIKDSYFIGVDNGTQSTKTIIIDGKTGSVIGKATKGYGMIEGLPIEHKEQEVAVWIKALLKTLKL